MKFAKHDLRPILSCRTRNSATQTPSAPATARNLLFWWSQFASATATLLNLYSTSSIELLKNGFFGSNNALVAKHSQFLSYRIVIYTKRKVIFNFISCIIAEKRGKLRSHFASLKMHRMHAHRKFQPKWVRKRTLQLATAHRNSQLVIAHRKSCFVK